MPGRKRSSLGRHTVPTQSARRRTQNMPDAQRLQQNEAGRVHIAQTRDAESDEQREARRHDERERQQARRVHTTDAQRLQNRTRMQNIRALTAAEFNRIAFNYEPNIDYASHALVTIGNMDQECNFCHALKFKNETTGMCCSAGKVILPALQLPPEPLQSLMSGADDDSKIFLGSIRKFNSCFQMTSFAAKIDQQHPNFQTTFKIQGQVYHRIGSLLPMNTEEPKFLQIYFMGDLQEQTDLRCRNLHINTSDERAIVPKLEHFMAEHNNLIQLFQRVSPRLQNDNYTIIIKPDKMPIDEHARRFNSPTVDEVGIVMVGEAFEHRDIRIRRRDNTLHNIADTHRSYDALQYPLIFWGGDDRYHINIKQRNPTTGIIRRYYLYIQLEHIFSLLYRC